MKVTDNILLALEFELRQNYLASKYQALLDKQQKRGLNLIVICTAEKRGGYAIKTPSFEVEEGGCRQRPPSILWFGRGSCSSTVVLTTSLIR